MTAQVVAVKEFIEDLTETTDRRRDIPAIINSPISGAVKSIGRPAAMSVAAAGEVDGFRTRKYIRREGAPRTKATPIN